MRFFIAVFLMLASVTAFACEEAKEAINELEQTIASNGAPHTPVPVAPSAETAPFVQSAANEAELLNWAQTSTFGGGRLLETDFHGERVLIVYRGYTSGVKSSDIGVYASRGGAWTLVKSHPVVMNTWIEAVNNGEDIVFHPEGNPKPVMVFSKADLPQ